MRTSAEVSKYVTGRGGVEHFSLCRRGDELLVFVEDRCRAIVLDYFSQRVEDKIAFFRNNQGLVLACGSHPSRSGANVQ